MLLGDPYKFAIILETIKEGDMVDDTWHNGVLLFCVDGAIFPKRILTAPLGCEIDPLKENLENIAVSDGDQVRILAAKRQYKKDAMRPTFNNATAKEAFISVQELKEMAKALKIE